MSRADDIFAEAVQGLKEYYPVLEDADVVTEIRAEVEVPDTGNNHNDYLDVKDQVELLAEEHSPEFINYYECPECGHKWEDTWTAMCDDDCPNCGCRHISPYESEDA